MRTSKPTPNAPTVITDLISSRLHVLAALSAASATLRYQRKFSLSLLEWRAIGMLGGFAPLSLKELARGAALDRSYASRTVSGLIERGLVLSQRDGADGRGVKLSLTGAGQALYRRVFADAAARNEQLLGPLNPKEREELFKLLTVLAVSARRLLDEERAAAGTAAGDVEPAPARKTRRAAAPQAETQPADTDLSEARYLAARLQELLGAKK